MVLYSQSIYQMNSAPQRSSARTGFTLIELLAVIAVIAVVIAFAVPATNTILRGSQLSQGGQLIGDQLAYARQLALTKNRTTEFRFYKFGDPEMPGENVDEPATGRWRGFQIFEILDNGAAVPVSAFQRMPRMTVFEADKYSTLLDRTIRGLPKDAANDPTAPAIPIEINGKAVGQSYQYMSLRFLPDGVTNLPPKAKKQGGNGDETDGWYVTVIALSDEGKELENINFATIQIDPFTGSQKSFRPTVGGRPASP